MVFPFKKENYVVEQGFSEFKKQVNMLEQELKYFGVTYRENPQRILWARKGRESGTTTFSGLS